MDWHKASGQKAHNETNGFKNDKNTKFSIIKMDFLPLQGQIQKEVKMKKIAMLFAMVWLANACFAQYAEPSVVPDRPGHSWDAEVTPHHKLILDYGWGYEKGIDETRTFTLSNAVFRYGLFENMELRVGTDFLVYENDATGPTFGIAPLAVGTKIKLYEGSGILPSVGMLAELKSSHVGTKDQLPSHLAPSAYLLFEHSIGERFSLCYNAGLEWDGETAAPTTYLALSLGYNITDDLGVFAESNNYLHADGNKYMAEFGITWLASRRVQLDLEADLDLMDIGKCYAIGCGIAWLIN